MLSYACSANTTRKSSDLSAKINANSPHAVLPSKRRTPCVSCSITIYLRYYYSLLHNHHCSRSFHTGTEMVLSICFDSQRYLSIEQRFLFRLNMVCERSKRNSINVSPPNPTVRIIFVLNYSSHCSSNESPVHQAMLKPGNTSSRNFALPRCGTSSWIPSMP